MDLAGFLETKKTIKKESQTRGEENVYEERHGFLEIFYVEKSLDRMFPMLLHGQKILHYQSFTTLNQILFT